MTDNTIREAGQIADRAVAALWSFYKRPKPDGNTWGDLDGISSKEEYARVLGERAGKLGETCRMALRDPGMRPDETKALKAFLRLNKATELADRELR